MNQKSYFTQLKCSKCNNGSLDKRDTIGHWLTLYICKSCGHRFWYDLTPMPSMEELKFDKRARELTNPYRYFSRGLKFIGG